LAAGIAHEINTPMQYIGDNTHFLKATLTRLLALAEAAQRAVADDATEEDRSALAEIVEKSKLPMLAERGPKAAEDALAGVDNVSRIVTAMKRFSHPGSDDMEPVDLNEAITTTMTVCRNEWKYSAEIDARLAEDLPIIEGRLGPLNQVWLNMIVNATHAIADRHGEEKGVITIITKPIDDGRAVQVSIGDNGVGISRENVDRIFDHFFTAKPVGKGTGQGLAIAHQVIVAEHNGTISVDSTLGEGTTFTMTIPTVQPTDEPSEDHDR
jgi:signal transduction histidine kinase